MTLPRPLRVAIQGERGSFSEEAACLLLGRALRFVHSSDTPHLFSLLNRQDAHVALLPVETSENGPIYPNWDLMMQQAMVVCGEVYLHLHHCLIAPVGTFFEDVRQVYSHPIALGQCRGFFRRHDRLEAISTHDTAGSVQRIVTERRADAAAIAGKSAAHHYAAKVLLEGIEDDPSNYARFFLLAREDAAIEVREDLAGHVAGPAGQKTSILFCLDDEPGILYRALHAFASRGIGITKIDTRPVRGTPREALFYLDFLGDRHGEACAEALLELENRAGFLRIFGSYPAGGYDWLGEDAPLLPRSRDRSPPPRSDPGGADETSG